MDIRGKTAVVTGGASGLGLATVKSLLDQGARVAVFDLNAEAGEAVVAEHGSDKVMFRSVNVSDADSVSSAINDVVDQWDALHICVNCAGIATAGKVLDREGNALPLNEFSRAIEINLIGSFNVARLAAEKMAKNEPLNDSQERGVIINTSSVAGFEGQVGQAGYAASKGGILGLNLPMARDLAQWGIRVNAIAPGIMGTPMLLGMPENIQEALVSNIQFPKRLGYPSEYGDLAVHIIENSYLNGETIRLDGAIRLQPR